MQAELRRKQSGAPERLATRLIFLLCGIAQSAWAPLVPYAKLRVHANDSQLGLLLLCIGFGSMLAMPATGVLVGKYGCKALITAASIGTCLGLFAATNASTPALLGLALAIFGASLGALDVSMNVQALLVERDSGRSLMPGFHGMYSLGAIVGAGLISALLWGHLSPLTAVSTALTLMAALLIVSWRSLLTYGEHHDREDTERFRPTMAILTLGILAFIMFLAEGAMLDWSALCLIDRSGVPRSHAGIGYAFFSIAMTLSRLNGNRVIARLGRRSMMVTGAVLAAAGYVIAAVSHEAPFLILGFTLIGIGAANLVPVIFSLASEAGGKLGNTLSFVTSLGYTGILTGPAVIGVVVHAWGFGAAFGGVAALLLIVSFVTNRIAARAT